MRLVWQFYTLAILYFGNFIVVQFIVWKLLTGKNELFHFIEENQQPQNKAFKNQKRSSLFVSPNWPHAFFN